MNDFSKIYYQTEAEWQLAWLRMEKVLEEALDGTAPTPKAIAQALVIWNS